MRNLIGGLIVVSASVLLLIFQNCSGGGGGGGGDAAAGGDGGLGSVATLVKGTGFSNISGGKDFFDSKRSSSPENNEDLYVLNHLVTRYYPLEQTKNPDNTIVSVNTSDNSVNWRKTQAEIDSHFRTNNISCSDSTSDVDVHFVKRYSSGIRALMSIRNEYASGYWRACAQVWVKMDDDGNITDVDVITLDGAEVELMTSPVYEADGNFYSLDRNTRQFLFFNDNDTAITTTELNVNMGTDRTDNMLFNASALGHNGARIDNPDAFIGHNNRLFVVFTVNSRNSQPTLALRSLLIHNLNTKFTDDFELDRESWGWASNINTKYYDLDMEPMDDKRIAIMYDDGTEVSLRVFDFENYNVDSRDNFKPPSERNAYVSERRGSNKLVFHNDILYLLNNYGAVPTSNPELGGKRQMAAITTYSGNNLSLKNVKVILPSNHYKATDLKFNSDSVELLVERISSNPTYEMDTKYLGQDVAGNDRLNFTLDKAGFENLSDFNNYNAQLIDSRFTPPPPPAPPSGGGGGGGGYDASQCEGSGATPFGDVQLDVFCQAACHAKLDPGTDDAVADEYCSILDQYVAVGSLSSNSCQYCR